MVIDWLTVNYIEVFGAVTGLLYIWFSVRQNILLWPVGIVSSAVYIWIFLVAKLYADMSLQVYYLIMSIYGWYFWIKGRKNEENDQILVSKTSNILRVNLSLITIGLWILMFFILKKFTDSNVPVADSLVTALSITATWMLTKKKLEQWLVWILVNIMSVALFFYKELYATVFLYIILGIMAYVGYIRWKKDLIHEKLGQNR
jgi:nicotinamide mononucleotide transporter